MEDDILTWDEAAAFLGVHKRTLARWYAEGEGPPRIKVQRQILYSKKTLLKWLASQEVAPCRTR